MAYIGGRADAAAYAAGVRIGNTVKALTVTSSPYVDSFELGRELSRHEVYGLFEAVRNAVPEGARRDAIRQGLVDALVVTR